MQGLLQFNQDWTIDAQGQLRAGGQLSVRYHAGRLPFCRQRFSSLHWWEITAEIRFFPRYRPDVFHWNGNENQGAGFLEPPWILNIPVYATGFEIWFSNRNTSGGECVFWDSRFGSNYWFDVEPF